MKRYLSVIIAIAFVFGIGANYVSAQTQSPTCVSITQFLREGAVDAEVSVADVGQVTKLQLFLTDYGTLKVPNDAYGYFGILTTKALLAWQKKVGIVTKDTSVESVEYAKTGPITRAKILEVSCAGVKPIDPVITLSAPVAGATFVAGSSIKVSWNTKNITAGKKITVSLMKGSNLVSSQEVSNSKNTSVKTATTTVAGADYKVKLSYVAEGEPVATTESGLFSITSAPVYVPTLTVTEPTNGAEVNVGKNITVKWTTENITGGSYKIELYKGDRNAASTNAVLVTSVVATASKSKVVKIPADAVPGADYFFKVIHTKGNVITENKSDSFKVMALPSAAMAIPYPATGAVLSAGGSFNVNWISQAIRTNEKVLIELVKGGVTYAYAVSTNNGKQAIKIPKNAPAGSDYVIKITYSGYEAPAPVVATSQPFQIVVPVSAVADPIDQTASAVNASRGILDIILSLFR